MFTVSVRFNCVAVRALKQSIVQCKLLISASGITVFVGSNITDATLISLPHKPQHLRYFFNRETHYLIQLCISGIVIRAFIAILIP